MAAAAARAVVAVGQLCSTGVLLENLAAVQRLARKATAAGATMLFLPEASTLISSRKGQAQEEIPKHYTMIMDTLSSISKECSLWLSIGAQTLPTDPDVPKLRNSHLLFNPAGALVATYTKCHLFDVDAAAAGVTLAESSYTDPGAKLQVVNGTPVGTIGVSICYDVRFPSFYQRLRFEGGATTLIVPSAFTFRTGEAHWEVLLRARAIETQCFVIAAAQVGEHGAGRRSWGHSMVVDPWGKVLVQSDADEEDLLVTELDLGAIDRIRASMPIASHRKPALYAHGSPTLEVVDGSE
jgi:deaminated glutathione amidase